MAVSKEYEDLLALLEQGLANPSRLGDYTASSRKRGVIGLRVLVLRVLPCNTGVIDLSTLHTSQHFRSQDSLH